jgi:subtilisin
MSQDKPSPDSNGESMATARAEEPQATDATSGRSYDTREYEQHSADEHIADASTQTGSASAISGSPQHRLDYDLREFAEDTKNYILEKPGRSILASASVGFLVGLWLRSREVVKKHLVTTPQIDEQPTVRKHQAPSLRFHPSQQYVISNPRGFHTASGRYQDQLKRFLANQPVRILDSIPDAGDQLAVMTEQEVEQFKASLPGLVIEPNIPYKKSRHPLLESFQVINLPAAANTKKITINVADEISGLPIEDASIYLQIDAGAAAGFEGITDAQGNCTLVVRKSNRKYAALSILPKHGYWSRLFPDVVIEGTYRVLLRSLPYTHSAGYDWGHQFAGMKDGLQINPGAIRIGIIDTGICRDHPGITPAGGYNCVYSEDTSLWYRDEEGHGTHCAGVVAATIAKTGRGVKGYVPQAEILAYRVFADEADAFTFDIARAIQRAVDDGCDIINMSLGSPTIQTAIRVKTEMAYDRGVLSIAATGNESDVVNYPAAFNSVMGVGAFGKFGSYPDDSLHRATESSIRDGDGKYYLANFSNFGNGIDFCAPGVAIISTVPGGDYCAWDGTSMACPQVTGLAALALAANPDIFNAPRDAERVERLIQTLKGATEKLHFGSQYEGAGYLSLSSLGIA